eukprot:2529547-Amphidinium_carterae.1
MLKLATSSTQDHVKGLRKALEGAKPVVPSSLARLLTFWLADRGYRPHTNPVLQTLGFLYDCGRELWGTFFQTRETSRGVGRVSEKITENRMLTTSDITYQLERLAESHALLSRWTYMEVPQRTDKLDTTTHQSNKNYRT